VRFLIVDDSKAMRGIVMRSLRQAGYGDHSIEEATNGALALVAVRTAPPDFIFADMNMPEMGGMDLLKALREEGVRTKVGFITSESSQEVVSAAIAAGAEFVLSKPFTPNALKDALQRIFQ
jgi:two-component system, chemotaxis family, chemotaxis protein CheY